MRGGATRQGGERERERETVDHIDHTQMRNKSNAIPSFAETSIAPHNNARLLYY